MINEQLKKMKESINNIQNKLKDIDKTNQDTKVLPIDQIVPFTMQHNHCQQSESISSLDNIQSIQSAQFQYSPPRHHLNDSEMKKALRRCEKCDNYGEYSSIKKEKSSKNKMKKDEGKYVVFSPQTIESQYGQISNQYVVKVKSKDKNKKYKQGYQDHELKNRYDIKTSEYWDLDIKKSKRKRQAKESKSKSRNKNKWMKEDAPIEKHTKNIRTQCTIETQRIKLPFINDWNPDTDEQFSDFEF